MVAARRGIGFLYNREARDDDAGDGDENVTYEGQDHVFAFKEELSEEELEELTRQVAEIDEEALGRTFHRATRQLGGGGLRSRGHLARPSLLDFTRKDVPRALHGASVTIAGRTPPKFLKTWRSMGFTSLAQGRVAVVLLAGGPAPDWAGGTDCCSTGVLDIGLLSRKSLFQVYCERIQRLEHLVARSSLCTNDKAERNRYILATVAGELLGTGRPQPADDHPRVVIPLYVMVSLGVVHCSRTALARIWHNMQHNTQHKHSTSTAQLHGPDNKIYVFQHNIVSFRHKCISVR